MVGFTLFKKVMRSMWAAKKTYLACVFVIAIGITCFCALSSVCDSLLYSRARFYEDCRFADVFAKVAGMPESELDALRSIEGIAEAQGRLSANARVITENKDLVVTLHLTGIDMEATGQLNTFISEGAGGGTAEKPAAGQTPGGTAGGSVIGQAAGVWPAGVTTGSTEGNPTDGRHFAAAIGGADGILIGKSFLDANGLSPGSRIELALFGQVYPFAVSGSAHSPEYIYIMPEDGSLFPDSQTYDNAFVRRDVLENASGRPGIVTDLAFMLAPGWTFDDVKGALEEALDGYGLSMLASQDDQPSNLVVEQEFLSVESMSTSMSGLFLLIASAILYIMLRRLVEQERTQIGTLKAFGYSVGEIMAAYLLYGVLTGLAGGAAGALLSIPAANAMYSLYLTYFNFPSVDTQISFAYLAGGMALAVASGGAAALLGVRKVIGLNPAEAMRPSAPAYITKSIVDKISFLPRFLTKRGMMSLRFIGRNKLKSALIALSISLSYALMTVMFSFNVMTDMMLLDQFTLVQTFDIKAALKSYAPKGAVLSSVRSIEGVRLAEAVIEVPVSIANRNLSSPVMITGMNPGSSIYKIMDEDRRFYQPPVHGLIITKTFADKLGIEKGAVVSVSSPLLPEDKPMYVESVIKSSFGLGCYMDADALAAFLGLPPFANAVVLKADSGFSSSIKETLIEGGNVASVNDVNRILKTYNDMLESYSSMIYIVLAMAILVAFAVIYNISSISLSERQRELATMRVLGMTPAETAEVMTFEHWVIFAASVAAGVPMSIMFRYAMSISMQNDLYSIPTATPLSAYVFSALCCAAAVLLSNWAAAGKIKRFGLVDVLKERE